MFENRMLRKTFRSKRDEVIGEWRRLHNEELYDLYSSPNIIHVIKSGRMRWIGDVACIGETRSSYGVSVGNLRERPLGRPRCRWEGSIKINLQEVVWGHGLDCYGSG